MTTLIEFVELLVREIWLRNRRGGMNAKKRERKKSKGQVKFRNYR